MAKFSYQWLLQQWREYQDQLQAHGAEPMSAINPADYETSVQYARRKGVHCCPRCGFELGQEGWLVLRFEQPHPLWNQCPIVPCPACNKQGRRNT